MADYASRTQLKTLLRLDASFTEDDDLLDICLGAATAAINYGHTPFTTTIPDSIVMACLLQAGRFYKRRDALFGIAGSPEMGNEMRLLAKLDPDVALLVKSAYDMWGAA